MKNRYSVKILHFNSDNKENKSHVYCYTVFMKRKPNSIDHFLMQDEELDKTYTLLNFI